MTLRYTSLLLVIALLLGAPPVEAQLIFDGAISGGGPNADIGEGVAFGPDGVRYVVGTFEGTATFGDVSITSAGDSDIFLVKYDGASAVWARRAGSRLSDDIGRAVAVAPDGNVYITGYFYGIATWDGGDNLDGSLDNFGGYDAFLAKYTPEGNLVWVRQGGSTREDTGRDVAVDTAGNVYLAGSFEGPGGFDGVGVFGDTTLTSAGASDAFLVKYDADGDVVWARRGGSDQDDLAYGVAVSGDGRIHLAGSFFGTALFGDLPIQSGGQTDIFVVQYDADGEPVWVEGIGTEGYEYFRRGGIDLDTDGNVYLTGSFTNTIVLGPDELRSIGQTDVFVAKLDASGEGLWGRRGGGDGTDFSAAISVGDSHSGTYVFASGYIDRSGNFDGVSIDGQGRDGYLAVFLSDGSLASIDLLGGTGHDAGTSIASYQTGGALEFSATGSFRNTMEVDRTPLSSTGDSDMYLVRGVVPDGLPVEPGAGRPMTSALGNAHPNPFRDRTTLALDVAAAQDVTVEVFDVLGRRVATVHDGQLGTSQHRLVIEAGGLPAGVYIIRAEGEAFRFAQRVTLVR
jgi:hypothetical protein